METGNGRSAAAIPAPQLLAGEQRRSALGLVCCVVAIFALVAARGLATASGAEPVPGTPVAVAPGVPGDGRAWELVTPPESSSGQLLAAKAISASGDEFFYTSVGPLPGAASGYPLTLSNLARRGVDGWTTSPVAAPDPESEFLFSDGAPEAFGSDLDDSIWTNNMPKNAQGQTEKGIYRRTVDGRFELLATTAYGAPVQGASADLEHVLFTTEKHLLPADASRTEGPSVYEADGSTLRLVDVGDDGALLSNCGSLVPTWDPISRDGRRIFFVTHPDCTGPARAYLREDGSVTRAISTSQCTLPDCGPEADVSILGATPSGSSAFLLTTQKLTNEDTDETADLYRYDVESGQLTLLSAMPGVDPVPSADEVRSSEDGRVALFLAEAPAFGSGKHLFVATPAGLRLLAASAEPFAQVSTDGRYVLFASREALLPVDTDESVDVYRYDTQSKSLTRLSAGPTGGNGEFAATIEGQLSQETAPSQPYRAMSDDGSDVFFATAEALLPEDRNEVSDVYEWRSGALSLISSGGGDRPSVYMGATPDGKTVVFRTSETLLPLDRDGGDLDFYAARVGGGFPEPGPGASPCGGDSCLPPLAEPAASVTPASAMAGGGIRLKRPSPRARRRMAARGWIVLMAEVADAGRLRARARARIQRRRRLVASTTVDVASPGVLRLRMRLSSSARRVLSKGRPLHVRLALRLSGLGVRRIGFVLDRGR